MFRCWLELHRLWCQRNIWFAMLMLAGLITWVSSQLLLDQKLSLVLVPIFAYIFSDFYLSFLCGSWFYIVSHSGDFRHHILIAICYISIMLNLCSAVFLGVFYSLTVVKILVLWWLLDIMGFFIYVIRMTTRAASRTINYLMFIPMTYPLVVLGDMAWSGHLASIKLIMGLWLLLMISSSMVISFVSKT